VNLAVSWGSPSRDLLSLWRKEYGGMRVEPAKRLQELEKENSRLKKLVSDISLDNAILEEAVREKLLSPPRRLQPEPQGAS
jgi:hypothetical protein